MTFSEVINTTSLSIMSILFQRDRNSTNLPSVQLNLDNQIEITKIANRIVAIQLGTTSLNSIKFYFPMGNSTATTFISILSNTVRDMAGNEVVEISSTNAKQASEVIIDMLNPEINSFELNMSSGLLTIFFSETTCK